MYLASPEELHGVSKLHQYWYTGMLHAESLGVFRVRIRVGCSKMTTSDASGEITFVKMTFPTQCESNGALFQE